MNVFLFIDLLTGFCDQRLKVKVIASSDHIVPYEYNIFVNISDDFDKKLAHVCTWAWDILIGSKGQR